MYVKNPSLVAAQRVVVAGPVVALAARVGLLAGVLPHVHLHHGLPGRLVVAHVADVGLQPPVHRLHVLLEALRVGKVLLAQIALLLGAPRRKGG